MRIVVLGGTGFIGPYVVRRLAAAGHRVTVVHRGVQERDDLGEVRHVHADRAALSAAMAEVGEADVALDMAPFTEAAARVAVESLRGRVGRLVVISSVDVYRAFGAMLGIEDSPAPAGPVDEDAPLRSRLYPYRDSAAADAPEWLRDYDKIPIERLVMGEPEMPGTALRLGAVYGPGDRQHRLRPLVARIDDGRPAVALERSQAASRFPYVYVENVAAAIVAAVTDERAAGRIYNVGPERTPTVAEWTRAVGDALGWDGRVVLVDDGTLEAAEPGHGIDPVSTRLRSELGVEDPVDFATGVRRTADYEREHRGDGPTREDYAREDAVLAALQP